MRLKTLLKLYPPQQEVPTPYLRRRSETLLNKLLILSELSIKVDRHFLIENRFALYQLSLRSSYSRTELHKKFECFAKLQATLLALKHPQLVVVESNGAAKPMSKVLPRLPNTLWSLLVTKPTREACNEK